MEPLTDAPDSDATAAGTAADLVVVNGRVVTPEGVRAGTVVVRDGRIDAVLDPGLPVPPGPRLDAGGQYVLPGLIDSHVHFRTPGLEYKEDWAHGSRAAVVGGVTTVLDMPNTRPFSLDPDALVAKAGLIEGNSWVDYRFHLGADPHNPSVLADVDPRIATSAKVFMAGHATAPVVATEYEQLRGIFEAAAAGGMRLVLHAEDQHVFDLLDTWRGEPESYAEYEPHRPRTGAIVAVARVVELVRRYGTSAHVLHVSTAEEVDLLVAAAAEGLPVSFEVTGHHLSFTDADTCRRGPRTRLSPAIRGLADQRRLWQAVLTGQAASLGSDHAPHTVEEKNRPAALAPPGLPGVQELAVGVWTGLLARHRTPDLAAADLARLMGAGPADLFRLPGKGRIAVGADADLVLFDPDTRWQLSSAQVRSKCGWSAYEGWTFTGQVRTTVKSGRVLWDVDGGFTGTPSGRWLTPAPLDAGTAAEAGTGTEAGTGAARVAAVAR